MSIISDDATISEDKHCWLPYLLQLQYTYHSSIQLRSHSRKDKRPTLPVIFIRYDEYGANSMTILTRIDILSGFAEA